MLLAESLLFSSCSSAENPGASRIRVAPSIPATSMIAMSRASLIERSEHIGRKFVREDAALLMLFPILNRRNRCDKNTPSWKSFVLAKTLVGPAAPIEKEPVALLAHHAAGRSLEAGNRGVGFAAVVMLLLLAVHAAIGFGQQFLRVGAVFRINGAAHAQGQQIFATDLAAGGFCQLAQAD